MTHTNHADIGNQSALSTANLCWKTDTDGHTVPTSVQFDDVYFSHAGGLAETYHVFLHGNQLPKRFAQLQDNLPQNPPQQTRFVIAETGFGTGLNFLATCQLWQNTAPKSAKLHFISTEKFPLSRQDLAQALSAWRQDASLVPWIDALLDAYPLPLTGCHRLHIGDAITLDLWLGDALDSFAQLIQTQTAGSLRVDAWFLDGFAPAKNSDMWSQALFDTMAKLSHDQSSIATFTAAGFVRRGLLAAGFDVVKSKGFGKKREMLQSADTPNQPNFPKQAAITHKRIAIIGGGISGVSLAQALARRGHDVSIFDAKPIMSAASGNPCALFSPKLTLLEQACNHLPTVSFLYAHRHYKALNQTYTVMDNTGVIDLLLPSQKTADKHRTMISDYPDDLIDEFDLVSLKQDALADDLKSANIVAHVPMGGILYPANIAKSIECCQRICHQRLSIEQIDEHEQNVRLTAFDDTGNREQFDFDRVVICAGFMSHQLDDGLFNCRKIRGQVSWTAISDDESSAHQQWRAIKYDGYCSQFFDPISEKPSLLFGASFVRNCTDTAVHNDEHQFNYQKLRQALPQYCQKLGITQNSQLIGRAGVRAQTPDYHPLVGKIANRQHSYCLYGMGSKGFSFAPLCGEILADLLDGGILPITAALLDKLSPARKRLQTPISDNVD
ncbi:tRNA (5-methylaminomethyl-2-thiouridine)(34)-methyltransferase MnmD [Moraxella sp. ZJ142]|uniref:tRNA (5-methylaminomethyl-2-thiouridine)(34)-methyltransferase MnmD n=1 Tax=Moraxella marmotae TaxID=3344520 RepID=UPI0035D51D85